jgi:hypothetical protein
MVVYQIGFETCVHQVVIHFFNQERRMEEKNLALEERRSVPLLFVVGHLNQQAITEDPLAYSSCRVAFAPRCERVRNSKIVD